MIIFFFFLPLRSVPAIRWHDANVLQLLQASYCGAMQHPETKRLLGQSWQDQMVHDIPNQGSRVKCETSHRFLAGVKQQKCQIKMNLHQWSATSGWCLPPKAGVPSWNQPLLTRSYKRLTTSVLLQPLLFCYIIILGLWLIRPQNSRRQLSGAFFFRHYLKKKKSAVLSLDSLLGHSEL